MIDPNSQSKDQTSSIRVIQDNRFSKEFRLLNAKSFSNVFDSDFKSSIPEFTLIAKKNSVMINCIQNERKNNGSNIYIGHPRIGLVVAKKHVKHAHERNRLKRLSREFFRLNKNQLYNCDYVIIFRKPAVKLTNNEIFEKLKYLFNKSCRYFRKPLLN